MILAGKESVFISEAGGQILRFRIYFSMKTDVSRNRFFPFLRRVGCVAVLSGMAFFLSDSAFASPQGDFCELQLRVKRKGADPAEMRRFADCLMNGIGTEKNPNRAMTWYGNAADFGDAGALEALRKLSRSRIKVPLPKPLVPPGKKFSKEEERRATIKLLKHLLETHKKHMLRGDIFTKRRYVRPSIPLVQECLRAGANPHLFIPREELDGGGTATEEVFSFVLTYCDFELLKLLVANGADCNLRWRKYLERAVRELNTNYKFMEADKRSKEKPKTAEEAKLERASQKRHQETYQMAYRRLENMLKLGANPLLLDGSGKTTMGKAWSPPAVRLLMKYGGDINQPNNPDDNCSGNPGWGDPGRSSPIFDAILYNEYYGVKAMIDAGADLHFVNADGKTPLDAAEENARERSGNFKIIADEIVKLIKAAQGRRGRS